MVPSKNAIDYGLYTEKALYCLACDIDIDYDEACEKTSSDIKLFIISNNKLKEEEGDNKDIVLRIDDATIVTDSIQQALDFLEYVNFANVEDLEQEGIEIKRLTDYVVDGNILFTTNVMFVEA